MKPILKSGATNKDKFLVISIIDLETQILPKSKNVLVSEEKNYWYWE